METGLGAPYSVPHAVRYTDAAPLLPTRCKARFRPIEGVKRTPFWGAIRAQPLGAITHARGRTMHAHA